MKYQTQIKILDRLSKEVPKLEIRLLYHILFKQSKDHLFSQGLVGYYLKEILLKEVPIVRTLLENLEKRELAQTGRTPYETGYLIWTTELGRELLTYMGLATLKPPKIIYDNDTVEKLFTTTYIHIEPTHIDQPPSTIA
jgi:hypothetical protein